MSEGNEEGLERIEGVEEEGEEEEGVKVGGLLQYLCNINIVLTLDTQQNHLLHHAKMHSPGYLNRKDAVEKVFFVCLGQDPELKRLCKMVDIPIPGTKKRQVMEVFYYLVSGRKTEEKKMVLNKCLVTFAFLGLKTSEGTPYQPNTCATSLKMLFSRFKVRVLSYPVLKIEKRVRIRK